MRKRMNGSEGFEEKLKEVIRPLRRNNGVDSESLLSEKYSDEVDLEGYPFESEPTIEKDSFWLWCKKHISFPNLYSHVNMIAFMALLGVTIYATSTLKCPEGGQPPQIVEPKMY